MLSITQGTSLLGADDKISLAPTGGSLLQPGGRDLGIEGWLQTHAGAWCLVLCDA
jgi:hypothetical protein